MRSALRNVLIYGAVAALALSCLKLLALSPLLVDWGRELAAVVIALVGVVVGMLVRERSDPSLIATTLRQRLPPSSITYHQVILGSVRASGGTRWLTNEEISAGVLDAIARAEPEYIVGTVQPGRRVGVDP